MQPLLDLTGVTYDGGMRPVVLCGMKHCGKSSLGRIIAKESDSRFHDLDDLLLEQAGNSWENVRELYKALGSEEFRRYEAQAARFFVEWVVRNPPDGRANAPVLALGGGTVENSEALAWLEDRGVVVYLEADPAMLYDRVMAKGRPPFLSRSDPRGDFFRIYERRDPLYRRLADHIHPVDDAPKAVNADRLMTLLRRHHAR